MYLSKIWLVANTTHVFEKLEISDTITHVIQSCMKFIWLGNMIICMKFIEWARVKIISSFNINKRENQPVEQFVIYSKCFILGFDSYITKR